MAAAAATAARSFLLALRPAAVKLDTSTRQLITSLGLARRGSRAGHHVLRCRRISIVNSTNIHPGITVITARRALPTDGTNIKMFHGRREDRVSAIHRIDRTALLPPVNFGVFNARSVHNKSASINEWIASNNLRLAAVVETWHDSLDCPDLIACAPPGYHYFEHARPRSDANVASFHVNQVASVCSTTTRFTLNE